MTTKGFAIFKNGKRTVRRTFDTYEQARQHIRKIVRKMGPDQYNAKQSGTFGWDSVSKNPPSYGSLGYEVRQVPGIKMPEVTSVGKW